MVVGSTSHIPLIPSALRTSMWRCHYQGDRLALAAVLAVRVWSHGTCRTAHFNAMRVHDGTRTRISFSTAVCRTCTTERCLRFIHASLRHMRLFDAVLDAWSSDKQRRRLVLTSPLKADERLSSPAHLTCCQLVCLELLQHIVGHHQSPW